MVELMKADPWLGKTCKCIKCWSAWLSGEETKQQQQQNPVHYWYKMLLLDLQDFVSSNDWVVSKFHTYMSSLKSPSYNVMFYDLQTFGSQLVVHMSTWG